MMLDTNEIEIVPNLSLNFNKIDEDEVGRNTCRAAHDDVTVEKHSGLLNYPL